jgi:Universal stress protein family
VTQLDPDLLASQHPIRAGAVRSVGSRVVVLYEPGRSGSAALDLARRLVAGDGSALTVVTVAPQDTRIRCGAGSATDYNRAVCEAAEAELREACEVLGQAGKRAVFKLLVQDKDPPLADWITAGGFDVVLLPARRRPLRRSGHPAADQLRRSTCARVRVVDAPQQL